MLMEGVITLIIVAALFYVAPGVMNSVQTSTGLLCTNAAQGGACVQSTAALNATQATIATTAAGALNLSAIGLIMLGIGIMIGGFMLIRGYK